MSKIRVWVLDPDVNKRRIDARVLKILNAVEDCVYVEDPWFFRDYGHVKAPYFKRIGDFGKINIKHTYKDIISGRDTTTKIGFVLHPKYSYALDYLKGRRDVEVIRLV